MPSMDYTRLDQKAAALGCPLLRDEPLAPRTTFKTGRPADRLLAVCTEAQLAGLLEVLKEAGVPWLTLGRGSNLLVGDRGFRGAVLCLEGDFKRI